MRTHKIGQLIKPMFLNGQILGLKDPLNELQLNQASDRNLPDVERDGH
jgi:hypothetical protein